VYLFGLSLIQEAESSFVHSGLIRDDSTV